MLEEVLRHLKNWFVRWDGIHPGVYTIKDGGITLPFLRPGQYFRVVDSVFNDGVYQYPASGLKDETFHGAIWALAVPQAVVGLSGEISAWQEKNGAVATSPYTSEHFGGYSYAKNAGGSADAAINSWQDAFRGRLDQWRKL